MEQIINYCGQPAKVACDEQCNKAWGASERPTISLSDNEDDFAWLADNELGIPNKWCVRECERCAMSNPGESKKPLALRDFSKRVYNIPR